METAVCEDVLSWGKTLIDSNFLTEKICKSIMETDERNGPAVLLASKLAIHPLMQGYIDDICNRAVTLLKEEGNILSPIKHGLESMLVLWDMQLLSQEQKDFCIKRVHDLLDDGYYIATGCYLISKVPILTYYASASVDKLFGTLSCYILSEEKNLFEATEQAWYDLFRHNHTLVDRIWQFIEKEAKSKHVCKQQSLWKDLLCLS